MTESNGGRLRYIDVLKTIGILLVVSTHTNLFIEDLDPGAWDFLYFVCIFHMPLFFWAYGLAIPIDNCRKLEKLSDQKGSIAIDPLSILGICLGKTISSRSGHH